MDCNGAAVRICADRRCLHPLAIKVTYELTQFIPLIIIVLLTIVFYIMGHNDKRNQDVVVELVTGESEVSQRPQR